MTRGRAIGFGAAALAVGATVLAWTFLTPVQLGGGTSYAIVVGRSMEPSLHRGDLAIVRQRSAYRPGDVVLYDSRQLGAKVLHRIVRVEDDRYVLKGDNNDFLDPERPTGDQIVGTLWVAAPGVGKVTDWLRRPLHGAFFVGVVTLIALGGAAGGSAGVRRGPRSRPHVRRPLDSRHALVLGGTAVAAVALAAVSFGRPATTTAPVDGAYVHQGRFGYEAAVARNAAYPDGRVETGDPVFLRLVSRLRVSFGYALESRRAAEVGGRIALDARISDGRGWERTLPVAVERPFSGRAATVDGVLDLARIERIVEDVRTLTGSAQSAFTVSLLPRVELDGHAGSERIEASFAPALAFDYGDLRLQPRLDAAEGVGPLAPRESVTGTGSVASRLSLGPLAPTVATARRVSLLALAALLLLGGLALALRRRGEDDEHARLVAAHGHLLVPVLAVPQAEDAPDVADFDALVRLAEHHGRLILHAPDGGGRVYVVQDGAAVYRYRSEPALPPPAPLPLRVGSESR